MTDADLLDALRDCYEPLLRRDIVAAHLVRSASISVDSEAPGAGIAGVPVRYVAKVTLHAPGRDEAANAQLTAQVENRLLGMPAISRVAITLMPALFPIL